MRKKTIRILFGHLLIILCFTLVVWTRGQQPAQVMVQRSEWLLILMGIHFFIALIFDKYNFEGRVSLKGMLFPVVYANLAFAGLVSMMFVMIGYLGIPRVLFFGTLTLLTIFELSMATLINLFSQAKKKDFTYETDETEPVRKEEAYSPPTIDPQSFLTVSGQAIRESVMSELGAGVFEYLKNHVPLGESSIVLSVNNRFNILNMPTRGIDTIVNLQRVNDHRYVNKFFETVNFKLPPGGKYAGLAEPGEERKKRFFNRYTPFFGIILYSIDFLLVRVAPKLPLTQKIYFSFTKGRKRVMSKAEILGRLYSCGFEVVDESIVDHKLFFVARKIRMPYYDNSPTYGPLIKLRRIGKDGKYIGVYKMRTMHPYAEYLQPYIHKNHDLECGGKFKNDFRVSTLGCIMRKLWIDELPMLFNWLKGELKLVGVRPLSEHYYNLYTPELQKRRIRYKPGLVPPFYADMPKTLEEIMASEEKYLTAYEKNPYLTDWKYFWKAFRNIVFRRARSK